MIYNNIIYKWKWFKNCHKSSAVYVGSGSSHHQHPN